MPCADATNDAVFGLPEVNAVVSIVIALTIIPVVLAARIAGAGAVSKSARAAAVQDAGRL